METLLDIKQNLIIEYKLPTVVTVTLVFIKSRNIMLMFYDYSLDGRKLSGASLLLSEFPWV